ncbi:hypothetical protein RQP46_008872 [Phenoliferia psychrophenolica]
MLIEYHLTARNFLWLTVPPMDRSPLAIGSHTSTAVNATVVNFNSQLKSYSARFKKSYPAANVLFFDAHKSFAQILDNALGLGFKDTGGGCDVYNKPGTTPNEYNAAECAYSLPDYFWLNARHPTWPVHKLLAERLATQLLNN